MDSYSGVKHVLNDGKPVITKCVELRSKIQMPIVSLGTYRLSGSSTIFRVIDAALGAGYRCFDLAPVYRNFNEIAVEFHKCLNKHQLKREDLFIISKLPPNQHGSEVENSVETQLKSLSMNYFDLFLIHWPGSSSTAPNNPNNKIARIQSWKEMIKLKNNGTLKCIGVSNFSANHLRDIVEATNVIPDVNQIEFHPHFQQPEELYTFCERYGILLQAYSPLGGDGRRNLFDEPSVKHAALKHKKNSAQILLRWGLQCGYAIVCKTASNERVVSNAELDFQLSADEFQSIKSIATVHKYAWDPDVVA